MDFNSDYKIITKMYIDGDFDTKMKKAAQTS